MKEDFSLLALHSGVQNKITITMYIRRNQETYYENARYDAELPGIRGKLTHCSLV